MGPTRRFREDQQLESAMEDGALAPPERERPSARAGKVESDAQLAGVIQREATGAGEGGSLEANLGSRIHSARSGGTPLPEELRLRMEDRFGADFSSVRVHQDGEAAALNRSVQAIAFTSGNDIFLGPGASASDETLLAHELTHVIQQGGQDVAPTTVGAAETPAEQAAETKAGEVAVTKAEEPKAEAAASPADEVQRFVDDKEVQGSYARVSDNGHVVVLGQSNYSQDLYASAQMIDSANQKLKASGEQGSYLSLVRTGDKIKHASHVLEKVAPVFTPQGDGSNAGLAKKNKGKDEDDKMSLWADCGRSSRVVMGSHDDASPHATYNSNGKQKDTADSSNPATYSETIYLEAIPQFLAHPANAKYLKDGIHYTGSKDNIIQPGDATEARKQYWELGEEGRRAFDAFAGINTAANPEVGGGYTLNTEYDMPGFKEMGDMTWNFHWAGVVMKDGTDNITLENYADGKGYDSVNTDWNFQMYGTVKKGQSFMEEHLSSNTHGSRGSAFAVEPEGS